MCLDNFEEKAAALSAALDAKEDCLETLAPVTTQSDSTPRLFNHHPRSFVERSKLPVFSGKVEEFPEFRKQFQELTKEEGFPEAILISKLKTAVLAEVRELLVGVDTISGAWSSLQKRYGDRKVAILTIQARLTKLTLFGEDHEKIEQLSREVSQAVNLLRHPDIHALDSLTRDFDMVGRLVAKLPRVYQTVLKWKKMSRQTGKSLLSG